MKKKLRCGLPLNNSGWLGIIARLSLVLLAVATLYWLPQIFIRISEIFFSQKITIDGRHHEMVKYAANFMFFISLLFEAITAAKLISQAYQTRKGRRKQENIERERL